MLLSGDAKIFICRVECGINRRLETYTSCNNSGNFWLHKIINLLQTFSECDICIPLSLQRLFEACCAPINV